MTIELAVVEYTPTELIANDAPDVGLDQNPAAVYLAGLRPTGRRSMHHYLNLVAAKLSNGQLDALSFNWSMVRYQHTTAIRAWLQEEYKPATANTILAALRRVLKEAWRLGQLDAEDYRRASDLATIKGESLLKGRALKPGEIRGLLDACADDVTAAGARDAALIAVLYGAGLRRSELAKLDLVDYEPATGALSIRGGKGNKDRMSYVGPGAEAALADWLEIRGNAPGSLFCPINKSRKFTEVKTMTDQAVLNILAKRGKQAGLTHFSPHDLRRSFISDLLDAGADIATVQKLAGHSNVTTTARYDRRGEVAKRKAAGMLHVPYQPRPKLKLP